MRLSGGFVGESMRCFWVGVLLVVLMFTSAVRGGTEMLALISQIQYSKVISGAVDPVYDYIYNTAPIGADTGNYKVTASYAPPEATGYTSFGYYYTGSIPANGGSSYATASFPLNTTGFNGGTAAVTTTLTDTDTGGFLTQNGQFTVLDHAAPGLYLQGQVIPLSSQTVITFRTPDTSDTGSLGAGGVATASSLGMQGRSPTAELDVDSITQTGSPNITTTLTPFDDLPSDSDPSEGMSFDLDFDAPFGEYNTTFCLHYSDEQDLPGADAPGSQVASFNVDVDVQSGFADWTVTTDVPEPGCTAIFLVLYGSCLRRWRK